MASKPKVLILIDHFLPGYKAGGPVRSCANMIERLKDRFEFSVLTRDREYLEKEPFSEVVSDAWNEFDGYSVHYISEAALGKERIEALIRDVGPDTVYINGIYSYYFSILPLRILRGKKDAPRVVVAPRGMLAPGAMGVKGLKKRAFLFLARSLGLFGNVVFHATTEQEAEEVHYWVGQRELHIVPNLLPMLRSDQDPGIEKRPGVLKLISVARIAPEKNTLGLLRSLAYQEEGEIQLNLYGPIYDKAYWEKCQSLIGRMPQGISVRHYSGIAPDRMPELIREHHAFILLTKGENFGHAVIEALLAGRPVLISDRTPWSDVEEKGAGHLLDPERPDRNLEKLRRFLSMDQNAFDEARSKGKAYGAEVLKKQEQEEGYRSLFLGI